MIQASDLLRDLEVAILGGEADVWQLNLPDGQRVVRQIVPSRDRMGLREAAPYLNSRTGVRPLLVAGTATTGLMRRALAGDVDLLLADPLQIVVGGIPYTDATELPLSAPRPRTPRQSRSWTRWAITRMFATTSHPLNQGEIASALETSQQNVSRILREMEGIDRAPSGRYYASVPTQLLNDWVAEYPGPGGAAFGWYSLDSTVSQTLQAYDIAQLSGTHPLISGDVAADELTPWRLPERGLLYLQAPLNLEDDGFVPAPLEEATLITVVPRDRTLWPAATWQYGKVPRHADYAIIYRDLLETGGPDSPDAARVLLESCTKSQ